MAKIQVLDVQTANRIAAGEVVERPASVAKELLENALDACATAVTLEIRGGGIEYLRVTDNGSGIPPEDCRVAFERHATSKIRSGDDLSRIGTLGFRGEALPSIASVSQVELTTRIKDAPAGVKLVIEGGQVQDLRQAGCPQGTTFVIKDLFFNTPVRRKFLKRPATEAGYVADVAYQLALSRPDIAVRFVNNGKPVFQTVGNGDLKSAIYVLHGKEVAGSVLPFEGNAGAMTCKGFVGVGNLARGNRNYEFFFVNGRSIRNAQLSAAVESACRERVMIGKYPYCVVNLTVPLDAVDVNVHPNKLEVRFKDDFPIRENLQTIIATAFSHSAEQLREVSDAVIPSEKAPEKSVNVLTQSTNPPVTVAQPYATQPKVTAHAEQLQMTQPATAPSFHQPAVKAAPRITGTPFKLRETEVLRSSADPMPWKNTSAPNSPPKANRNIEPPSKAQLPVKVPETHSQPATPVEPVGISAKVIGQLFSTYLLVQRDDKLLIIDQHAAHERILYERFRQELDDNKRSQPMLVPYLFKASIQEEVILNDNMHKLVSMGFEIEPFGDRTYRVLAVPMLLGAPQANDFFVELLDNLDTLATSEARDIKREELVQMACKRAIKAGDTLSQQEINTLLALIAGEDMPTCPHGRPIIVPITKHELERKFKRIQ